jgi:UDP-GlcNAc:undecaprenyl-phosphate GlcNAc-1-phosphate transferase
LAYYTAYKVRFEGVELAALYPSFLESLPLVLAIQVTVLLVTGAYRIVWRHYGLMDAVTLGKAVMFGTLTSVFVLVFVYRFENYSRGVFIIYGALLILMLAGSRASFRIISESIRRGVQAGDRLVIYGAGDGGVAAMRELLNQNDRPYQMLGFVDDDTSKLRTWIHGYPILGDYNGLVSLVMSDAIDCVVLGTRMIDSGRLSDLEKLCAEHNVKLSRMHVDFKSLVAVS